MGGGREMADRSHVGGLEVSLSAYARALVTYLDLPEHLQMNCFHFQREP